MRSKNTLFLIFFFITLNSCLAYKIQNYLHSKNTERDQLNHSACEYYANGEIYPKKGKNFEIAMISDLAIGIGLASLNPWIGGGYLLFGTITTGETIGPYTSGTWCGSPSNPLKPPYDFFYIVSSTYLYSCFKGPCRRSDGCELTEERKHEILNSFISDNNLDFCTEIKCFDQRKDNNTLYYDELPIMPKSLTLFKVETNQSNRCTYSFQVNGGLETLIKDIEIMKKQNSR